MTAERLIRPSPLPSSNSPTSSASARRLARFYPACRSTNLSRVGSISNKLQRFRLCSSSFLRLQCSFLRLQCSAKEAPKSMGLDDELVTGPVKEGSVLKQIAAAVGEHRKAVNAGAILILSALVMILIHPSTVPPALASFPAAGGTGVATAKGVRTELFTSAWTGFFAGCLHTLSGPDHLAALAPFSIGRTRVESVLVGALWGCGHDAGQIIFGLLFLLLKDRLHIEVIRTWGTRVVGLTLLVIGGMGIKEASESAPTPCAVLENGECDISTAYEPLETHVGGKKKIGFATFATGIVHGLQPDALMMVLPALALPSHLAGAAFLGMFLIGTIIAMGSYTVFIGSCSEALKDRVPKVTEKLTWASSLIAITLGISIIVSQFFGFSLY